MTIGHHDDGPDCELGNEETIAFQATWARVADECSGHVFVVKCAHCGVAVEDVHGLRAGGFVDGEEFDGGIARAQEATRRYWSGTSGR